MRSKSQARPCTLDFYRGQLVKIPFCFLSESCGGNNILIHRPETISQKSQVLKDYSVNDKRTSAFFALSGESIGGRVMELSIYELTLNPSTLSLNCNSLLILSLE